jgi:hypothetical protein
MASAPGICQAVDFTFLSLIEEKAQWQISTKTEPVVEDKSTAEFILPARQSLISALDRLAELLGKYIASTLKNQNLTNPRLTPLPPSSQTKYTIQQSLPLVSKAQALPAMMVVKSFRVLREFSPL